MLPVLMQHREHTLDYKEVWLFTRRKIAVFRNGFYGTKLSQ